MKNKAKQRCIRRCREHAFLLLSLLLLLLQTLLRVVPSFGWPLSSPPRRVTCLFVRCVCVKFFFHAAARPVTTKERNGNDNHPARSVLLFPMDSKPNCVECIGEVTRTASSTQIPHRSPTRRASSRSWFWFARFDFFLLFLCSLSGVKSGSLYF